MREGLRRRRSIGGRRDSDLVADEVVFVLFGEAFDDVGAGRVDGEVVGNVTAVSDQPSTLVVSEQARVEGEISVSHLVVNGEISGPVFVGEFLELQSRSRVKGDVHYNSLEMHLGAVVEGHLMHSSSEAKSVELKLATSKPTV